MLKNKLTETLERLTRSIPLSHLGKEREELSSFYRENRDKGKELNRLSSYHQRLVYLISRAPATYAAIAQVLMRIQRRWPQWEPSTLLDVGAGPGTALWAVLDLLPQIAKARLVERDEGFIALGKEIVNSIQNIDLEWIKSDFLTSQPFEPSDLVIASYSLGELSEKQLDGALEKLWEASKQVLVILEPGTPLGFSQILKMRQRLLSMGGHLLAPCPHAKGCPIEQPDWCHFSARVERSSLHRKIKGGTSNYEDEKYCYLAFTKEKTERCSSRVVRHPFFGSGFVKLKICSDSGLEEKTVTKKNKENYSVCRKIKWGDELN